MNTVDYSSKDHAEAIAKALDLFRFPHHCVFTGRTKEMLIKYRLAPGDLLDAARAHLRARLPLYCELQTMYSEEPTMGRIICPLMIGTIRLYFKFWLPKCECETDERMLVSSHDPDHPCPGEKK